MAQDNICVEPNYKAENERLKTKCERLTADLCRQADEMREMEKENRALQSLLADQERTSSILCAQMDVVRLIFGKG